MSNIEPQREIPGWAILLSLAIWSCFIWPELLWYFIGGYAIALTGRIIGWFLD